MKVGYQHFRYEVASSFQHPVAAESYVLTLGISPFTEAPAPRPNAFPWYPTVRSCVNLC